MASSAGAGMRRGAVVSLAGQWVKYVVQIGSVVVFSRMLSPADVGLVTAAGAITGVAWVLSDFGLSLVGLQADELSQDQKSMLFWANTAVGFVVMVVAAASAPLIAAFYDDHRLVPITLVGSTCFLFNGLASQFSVTLNRAGRFGVLSAVGALSQVIGLSAGVATILLGGSYWGLVVNQIAVALAALVGAAWCSGWWPCRPRRGVPMRHLYRFGGQTLGLQLATYITYNADSIAIGRRLGNAPLGLYNRAYQLSQVPALQLASPLTKVFMPALSRRRGDPAAYARLVGQIQIFLGYVLAGGLGLMVVESPAIIRLAFGPGWEGAVPALRVLSLASVAEMLGCVYYWLMLSWARTGRLFWVELGPRIVTITLIIVLVPHGIVAVAWAVVAGQVLALVLGAIFIVPAAGLRRLPFVGLVVRPALVTGAACAVLAVVLWRLPDLPAVVALLLGGAIWLAVVGAAAALPWVRADLMEMLRVGPALRRRRDRQPA